MFSREQRSSFMGYLQVEGSSQGALFSVVLDDLMPADHKPEPNAYLDCGGRKSRSAKRLYVPVRSFAEEPTILPNELSRTFITDIKRSRSYLIRLFKHQSTRFVQA